MFDNDWNINGRINRGFHMELPGQAWVATDLGKTYFLQMAYFQGRSNDGGFVGRMTGVKVHFCLEFQRPKEIKSNSFDINESMCPLCGEMKDIIFRQSAHIDFIPCKSPLQGRYLIFHITSIPGKKVVVENLGAVAVEMNIPH